MKVLLTGANGFLGSHILDELLESGGFEVSILLRRTGDTGFITSHMEGGVTVHYGSLSDEHALAAAVAGVDAVVHCAGKTKALGDDEYFAVNRDGTENVVRAVGARPGEIRHFVLVSSLAASGPGTPDRPARETASPRPLTAYGRSKLAAEEVVRRLTSVPWTIVRPAAIYGPRDRDFLTLFRMVKRGLALLPRGGRQFLSLVYGRDVAEAVRRCLGKEEAAGKIYNVAAEPPGSVAGLVHAIARVMNTRLLAVSVPAPVLYIACLFQEWVSRLTRRPRILSRQKWPELSAAGWVCSTDRIRDEVGFIAPTTLDEGLARTVAWYRREGWV